MLLLTFKMYETFFQLSERVELIRKYYVRVWLHSIQRYGADWVVSY